MPLPILPMIGAAAAGALVGSAGKKGGSGQPQQQVVTQTNLPEYARPYFENLMQRSSGLLNRPYIPFGFTQNQETGRVERALDPATGQPVNADRIADFTSQQRQLQQDILGQQTPGEFGVAGNLTQTAGLGSLQAAQYDPSQFTSQQVGMPNLQQFQMGPAMGVTAQQQTTPQMTAAQTQFQPNLNTFQMGPVREISSQMVGAPEMQGAQTSFGRQPLEQFRMQGPQMFGSEQAQQYMSPFLEQALEPQLRSAVSDARRAQITQDLDAARKGTFGGSRQLLASMEREKSLGQQMGDIRARGMQSAFENAQAQFERDRAAGMTTGQQNLDAALRQQQLGTQTGLQAEMANLSNEQQARVNNQAMQFQAQGMNQEQAMRAALANQGVDTTRAQANQQAALGVQQLGAQQGMQAALANLDAASQANVQNLAAQLQTQGLNAEQAMRAALANQQAGLTVGQQNLQAALQTQQLGAQTGLEALRANQQTDLERQRMAEQSRQFGAQQRLAGFGQAGQMGQTLTNIGSARSQADLARFGQQAQTAAQQQALDQQFLDQRYQDYQRQRDYDLEMLQQYNSLLRGVPVTPNSTQSVYAQQPGIAQQIMGVGLGGLGLANTLRGG